MLNPFQTIFERGSLGQLIVDFPSFRIDVVNGALCTMTGFSADELVGRGVAMIFPTGQDPIANTIQRLADGATDRYSAQRFCNAGTAPSFRSCQRWSRFATRTASPPSFSCSCRT